VFTWGWTNFDAIYVCTYKRIYIHVHTNVYTYIHVSHILMCVCVCVLAHTYIHTRTHKPSIIDRKISAPATAAPVFSVFFLYLLFRLSPLSCLSLTLYFFFVVRTECDFRNKMNLILSFAPSTKMTGFLSIFFDLVGCGMFC